MGIFVLSKKNSHWSYRFSFSLFCYTDLLGLDKQIQQDPQEFKKLFLSKVESFKVPLKSNSTESFTELLKGQEEYCTTCSICENVTKKIDNFHDLEISIEGIAF